MLSRLNNLIIDCSLSGWKTALTVVGFGLTMWQLQTVTATFPALTDGHTPFDMQNDLTSAQVYTQLSTYTEEAFGLYTWFQAVDFVFPMVAALMMAVITAFSVRVVMPDTYPKVVGNKLLLLFFVPALFDWLENIGFLWVISLWPEQSAAAANLAIMAKQAKLGTLFYAAQPIFGLLLVLALLKLAWLRIRPGYSG